VLAAVTPAGRSVVERATPDLMADGFGLAGYDGADLEALYALLRQLRVRAGDFEPAAAGETTRTS
jgi:hypothetical protein